MHFWKMRSILPHSKRPEKETQEMIMRLRRASPKEGVVIPKEDNMRRAMLCVLVAVFAFAGYGNRVAFAQETKAPAPKDQLRWHGTIVRWGKDQTSLDVRKGTVVKTIHVDSSTKWTQTQAGKVKPAEMSAFTEGSDVICIGKADEKGSFIASQIDLRNPGTGSKP